jgi:tubby-related protein 1
MRSIYREQGNHHIEKALAAKGFKGLRKCHVVRERHHGPNADQTRYSVFSERDGAFVVAALSTTGKSFAFSLDPDDFCPESPSYVGRMDCSFTGTTFTLYDYGVDAELLTPHMCGSLEAGGIGIVEHAVVIYDTNVLGRIPNAMTVHIPHIAGSAHRLSEDAPYHKAEAAEAGALAAVAASSNDFTRLKTRKPIWSDDLEAWTMDFHGRVKLASKKNFLLVSENAPKDVLMLFGKVSKTHFSLDYRAPLTVMQAFCVALTSFADKLMVT